VQAAKRFVEKGAQVKILCYDSGPLLDDIIDLGIDYSIEESRYRLFNALRKLVGEEKVVFSNLSSSLIVSILKLLRFKFRHIHRVCNTVSYESKQYLGVRKILYFFKLYFVARCSDAMVFQSESMYVDWMESTKYRPKNVFILANPIKVDGNFYLQRNRPVVCRCVSVGRLSEQKNYPKLLRMWGPSWANKLTIIGEGHLNVILEKIVRDRELENVELIGKRSDLPAYLISFHIYICPSRFEGVSNAVREAVVSGLPLITTDSPGCGGELVDKFGCGVMLSSDFTAKQLHDAICEIEGNYDSYVKKCEAARIQMLDEVESDFLQFLNFVHNLDVTV